MDAETRANPLDSREAGAATVRGSALRTLGYGVGMVLGLVSVPFLVRQLGIAEFGYYTAVTSLVALAGGLSEAGLTAVAVRAWTTNRSEHGVVLMRDLLGLRLALTLAGVVAVVAFAALVDYPSRVVAGTALAGAGMVVLSAQQAYTVPLQVELRGGLLAVFDVLRQAVTTVLTLALVVASAGLVAFLAVPIPAALATLAATIWFVRGRYPLRPAYDRGRWRALLREALPVAAALTVHNLYLRIVIVLMSLLTVAFETGIFAASYRVTEILFAVPFLVSQTVLPVLVHGANTDRDRLRYALARLFEAGLLAGAAVVLGVIAAAPIIIDVLAGDAGDPAIGVLRIQCVVVLLVFLSTIWQGALFALDHIPAVLVSNLIGLAAAAGVALALIPSHGAEGAAMAAVAGEVALAGSSLWLLHRHLPAIGLRAGVVVRVALAAGAGLAVLAVPGLPTLVDAVLGLLVFAAVALADGALTPELRTAGADVIAQRRSAPAP